MDLKDKIAVVTGGTSGIGEGTVIEFIKHGATTIFTGRNDEKGNRVLDRISRLNYPGKAVFKKCDTSSEESVRALGVYVKKTFGNCEILFNNAGIHISGKLHETPHEDWDRIMSIDLRGVYLNCYYFLPHMLERKHGAIIMMSSVSGICGDYSMAAYNAAKGAICNLTRAMALDYATQGIRVNCVCPGATRSEILQHTFDSVPGAEEAFKSVYPTQTIGETKDVAELVVFLASDKAKFINGTNIPIDGGLTAHTGQPNIGKY